ncbi:protein of unknown function (plasmid) [Cupriavidus taiwanensis]|uniref:Uncharacterized protein n=1 Tax=Cupriavidus taiwanensis TaxID=164546 RepID=A0A375HKY3_9BURK|nr:hypothetical protein CBM2592_B110118 [Cupriavidus taiwanensis]SOY63666.1 hypothetical protein CBM2588_B140113 [Cupriavidus taiwanensis]SOY93784.1 hypothetical protein CBM2591_B100091 [Cupriavidus taiwanensis]SOZ27042.1 hypothetical protein CBM2608_B100115 [Cupriavidus taiwanensis]SOZ69033.1 hypothetical protein CBM2617_B140003 [Cupriavidus taiwanensis]
MLRPMSRIMPQPARFACGHFFYVDAKLMAEI